MKKTSALFVLLCTCCVTICAQIVVPNFDGPSSSGRQEEQPMFPGCEEVEDLDERKICADQKMLQFVYGNIRYPAEARREGIEGMVVIKFFVEEDGSIWDAEILRDIGGGCGKEALRVIESMPDWNPGTIDGNPIGVSYNMPVKFWLGKEKKN